MAITEQPNRASLVKVLTSALANRHAAEVLADIINGIQGDIATLTAKLDDDAGVTDTDYEATISADNETID